MYIIHSKPQGHTYKVEVPIQAYPDSTNSFEFDKKSGKLFEIIPSKTASKSPKRFTLAMETAEIGNTLECYFGVAVFRNTTKIVQRPNSLHYIGGKEYWYIDTKPIEWFKRSIGYKKAVSKMRKCPYVKEYPIGTDIRKVFLEEFDNINSNPVGYYQEHFNKKPF